MQMEIVGNKFLNTIINGVHRHVRVYARRTAYDDLTTNKLSECNAFSKISTKKS